MTRPCWSIGIAGMRSEENTRGAIFDGIKLKETHGTSGPLIRLRFFGGWEYSKKLVDDKDFVEKAYKGGVPMGGDLPKKASKAPTFAVWASKDPESVNAVWTDPDFDPDQKAVYYVRVLAIPTPRWSTHDSARNNLPLSKDVPATPQERAWSSPIWYTPEAMKTATK